MPCCTTVGDDDAVEQDGQADASKVGEILGELRPGEARVGGLECLRGYADVRPMPQDALVVRIWPRVRERGDRGEEDAVGRGKRLGRRDVQGAIETREGEECVRIGCGYAVV